MKLIRAALGLALISAVSTSAMADAWQEREILTRVRNQIIRINKLLDQAQQAGADNQSRLRMEYPSIREDLRTIELGIYQYINTPMEPAPIVPLDGGYIFKEGVDRLLDRRGLIKYSGYVVGAVSYVMIVALISLIALPYLLHL